MYSIKKVNSRGFKRFSLALTWQRRRVITCGHDCELQDRRETRQSRRWKNVVLNVNLTYIMRRLLQLHTLFLFLSQWGTAHTRAADASFLSDTLVRKDQLQHVLEHEPAQSASCEKTVRARLLRLLNRNRSERYSAAHRAHRDYAMRL